jgi:hypothetical protein
MVSLVNRAKMSTSTTGTGTITLGGAEGGYQSFADAGVTDGQEVRYTIEDGADWEIGTGTYTASGTTLSRTVLESSNSDSAINLSGSAVVFVTTAAEDIQQPPSEGPFVDGDKTKLDGIESGADVTDTANVTAAGALMDSEVTNLADVKTFDPADYATAAQGALADSAQQPPSEGPFVDGDKTKLDGIESGADVTDTANVTAAGALMDSEVDADIKTLSLPANTTISVFGATLVDDADAAAARTTLGVDSAGTDNSTDVTLAGTPDYITISGQEITRGLIDLTTDVTGDLPVAAGGTGASTAAAARTNLGLVIGTNVQGYDADILKADTADQLTAGFTSRLDDDGTQSSGTYTPNPDTSNYKTITNGGAFTLAPPALEISEAVTLSVMIVNNASAGAITTSGFTQVTGDSFTTTNGHDFFCRIEVCRRGGGVTFSMLDVVALQ